MPYRIAFFADFHLRKVNDDFDRAISIIYHAVRPDGDIKADHVIIAGDIVDCAQIEVLEEFWDSLRKMNWSDPGQITIIPGNHDIFTFSKRPPYVNPSRPTTNLKKFNEIFSKTRRGSGSRQLIKGEPYPFLKVLDKNVSLAGFDSTRNGKYLPIHWASGEIHEYQAFAAMEGFSKLKTKHRIIVMHHCPWYDLYDVSESRLFPMGMAEPDADTAMKWIKTTGATLVLCGHIHTDSNGEPFIEKRHFGKNLMGLCSGTAGGVDNYEELRIYHVIDLLENGKINIQKCEIYPQEPDNDDGEEIEDDDEKYVAEQLYMDEENEDE
jgi:3',5'-cyclic AMP phosphodiesterase CpdA